MAKVANDKSTELPKRRGEPVAAASPDVVAERSAWIADLFPEAVAEGKIDFEKLKATLGAVVDTRPERYSLTWAGKRDAIQLLQVPSRATLQPVPDDSIEFDRTSDVFIEGDNLEVLKLLYKPYFGQVKLIYIDPPYNTGKDFVYRDDYADPLHAYLSLTGQSDSEGNLLTSNPETSGRYHSSWLSMMYPRMFLARQLLRDDGVVFVSIDDHESHNLRLLLNEVFGEENFIACIQWEKKKKPSFLHGQMATITESIMVYARNRSRVPAFTQGEKEQGKKFPLNNAGNSKSILRFPPGSVKFGMPDQTIEPADMSAGNIITALLDPVTIVAATNRDEFRLEGEWRYSQARLDEIVRNGEGLVIAQLPFRPNHVKEGGEPKKVANLLSFRTTGTPTYEDATEEIRTLFGADVYDYPKPCGLIKQLIDMADPDGTALVLDFFAGSCTTAHAVMELNLRGSGSRRFIMVQLPEPTPDPSAARSAGFTNVADIGKERMRRVIKDLGADLEGQLNLSGSTESTTLGFRTFALGPSNIKPWTGVAERDSQSYLEQMEWFADRLVDGWTVGGVIWETAIKEGFSLASRLEHVVDATKNDVWRVTDPSRDQSCLVCLDGALDPETPRSLELRPGTLFICRDSALDDELAANLALQCRLKTI
jgi:adenine-specific DNA-methyltransferase